MSSSSLDYLLSASLDAFNPSHSPGRRRKLLGGGQSQGNSKGPLYPSILHYGPLKDLGF